MAKIQAVPKKDISNRSPGLDPETKMKRKVVEESDLRELIEIVLMILKAVIVQ